MKKNREENKKNEKKSRVFLKKWGFGWGEKNSQRKTK